MNLVKLDDNVDIEKLEYWMNWMNPEGLMNPIPAGVTFMGGVNNGLAGSTHYFDATLEPGNYAFIAEVPKAGAKGLLQTFLVD